MKHEQPGRLFAVPVVDTGLKLYMYDFFYEGYPSSIY